MPKDEIFKADLLSLEVVEGISFERGQVYTINACGLLNSKRNRNDGCVLVGSQSTNENGELLNDVVIEGEECGIGPRHFIIKYNMDNKQYYLRDLGDGNGTFVRLDTPLLLKHGYIVSFGDSHMVVQIYREGKSSKIQLKFLDGPKTEQVFTFSDEEGEIRIGRMKSCKIQFSSHSLSRCQCVISYVNGSWILKDGDGTKLSTNGTWLFVDELYKIYNGMIFKAGQILFEAHLRRQM